MSQVPTPSSTVALSEGLPSKQSFDFMGLAPLAVVFVVFYFLVFRPQQKKMKQHRELLGALRRGDRVVTNGGMIGTISKIVNESEVQVEISDNVHVLMIRSSIADVLSKTGIVPAESSSEKGVKVSKPSLKRNPSKANRQ